MAESSNVGGDTMYENFGKLRPHNDKQFSELLHFIDKDSQRKYEYARFSKWLEFCIIIALILAMSFVIVYFGEKLPEKLEFLLASIPSMLGLAGYAGFRKLFRKKSGNQ
jgi:hypothetical protein